VFIVNPQVYSMLINEFNIQSSMYDIYNFSDIKVIADPNVPIYKKKWITKPHPWVEYDKSDEIWAIALGYGMWVDDTSQYAIYKVDEKMNFLGNIKIDYKGLA